jgi:hypothetical protein
MKSLKTLLIALCIGVMATACHQHHVTIVTTENNQIKMRIEYAGRIVFNDDQTGVLNMSRSGYFKYQRNGEKISVEADRKGNIVYEVNGDDKTTVLNDEGKRLLNEAIRAIAKEQARHRG